MYSIYTPNAISQNSAFASITGASALPMQDKSADPTKTEPAAPPVTSVSDPYTIRITPVEIFFLETKSFNLGS